VVILGVGLGGDPERLEQAVGKLAERGISVTWISALPMPDTVSTALRGVMNVRVCGSGISEAVSLTYDLPFGDLRPMIEGVSGDSAVSDMHHLLTAAMFAYRYEQDPSVYVKAIRHLAARAPRKELDRHAQAAIKFYERYGHRELAGRSKAIYDLHQKIVQIAGCAKARVQITGESGTGKESVALQIHAKSDRRDKPFIPFNCASVTPNLLESRFLGHEKGAFTSADKQTLGVFEQADGGTLFLDEIGELPLEAQGVLLRVLEGEKFTRMGGDKEIKVDVRLITATNRNLAEMVAKGTFREDLFYRLNVVPLHVPPLRERREDIAILADGYWLRNYGQHLAAEQLAALMGYEYPGNVRELHNLLERAAVTGRSDFTGLVAEQRNITRQMKGMVEPCEEELLGLDEVIRRHVRRVYEQNQCNLTRTSQVLGIAINTTKSYLGVKPAKA